MKSFLPALAFVLLAVGGPPGVEVFVERHGSTDTGAALFVEQAGQVVVEDFDDPDRFDPDTPVRVLQMGSVELSVESEWNGSYTPVVFSSTEFEFENRFSGQALVVGTRLTLTADRGQIPRAIGFWVFDDDRAQDSAYRIEILECSGDAWVLVLENDIDLNENLHELEGFVGVVSDVGIARMTITAIDPETGEPNGDLFEIDNVMVGEFSHPRRCRNLFHVPPGRPNQLPPDHRASPAG